ncbi:olfactory receptor 10A4-like [Phyllostomus hastatus]|uniref:olfactory receptor 10A4-like n=1 Tax=Phyllostomus hastatus TaxID=9423 RepID=UPI001E68339D|nr:olfactory receptor 10A4-like [Phyllostomus hastatus]
MWGNWKTVSQFVLVSFSALSSELQALLSLLFLTIYIITLMGNILMILVTTADSALQSPMYFFLRNLSFLEIGFNLVIVPKKLGTLITQDTSISFLGCASQMYLFFFFGAAECCLLATMAYDHYVAICDPLHYPVVMGHRACAQLTAASWFSGFPVATVQTTWIFSFPFCGPNRVNHIFCDSPSVIVALVCTDTSLFELEALTATVLFILFPFLLILGSCAQILSTIFRMPSAEGKCKAFSTSSSHLLVASLYHSTAILTHFQPRSSTSPENKKLLSLFYMVVTPMLNPIIYSLRSSEVKSALRQVIHTPGPKETMSDLDENRKGRMQGQRKEKQIPQLGF